MKSVTPIFSFLTQVTHYLNAVKIKKNIDCNIFAQTFFTTAHCYGTYYLQQISVLSRMLFSDWLHHSISIIIQQTHYEKSDWSRAFNQFTIACEVDMICNICCRYCIYHVKFNVCLVTKPLGVFSETKWLNASPLFLRMNYVKNVS